MPKCKKLMEKKNSSKIINLHELYIYITFNSMVKLHSTFVFETHFHWISTKFIMHFHIWSLLFFLHITPT
jgi:hypothetical protein